LKGVKLEELVRERIVPGYFHVGCPAPPMFSVANRDALRYRVCVSRITRIALCASLELPDIWTASFKGARPCAVHGWLSDDSGESCAIARARGARRRRAVALVGEALDEGEELGGCGV
jgi:hypothetical protein